MKGILTCVALALVLACGLTGPKHYHLTITSDTSWSGSLGGTSNSSSYDGTGNGSIEYWGEVCYVFQKQTDAGFLSAAFEETSSGNSSTSASFGVISGCNH